jgi:hypothetical protein
VNAETDMESPNYAAIPEDFTRLTDLDQVRAIANPGLRLEAMRDGARRLKDTIGSAGTAIGVRTFDIVTFPYPTRFGLGGAAASPAPFVMMRNRMQIVQVKSGSRTITVLLNPSDPERSMAAPFFAQQIERYGEFVSRKVMSTVHGNVADYLAKAGVAPESVDYITYDHLHVQDVRGLLGSTSPATPALLPNARLLAQREELYTLECPHPLQHMWYVDGCLRGVDPARIVALDGDYLIGEGLAIVRTPGHTGGNHSPVVVTDSGIWTISENGISVESYVPEHSEIRGLRKHAREAEVEVILNANTREQTLDQYTSMVLEKTLADKSSQNSDFPQHFPSSELTRSRLSPGLAPTFSHFEIKHGVLQTS